MLLEWREPYDVEGLLGFLALRAVPGVEEVVDRTYRRAVDGGVMEVTAGDAGFEVDERFARSARAVLDLDADPVRIDRTLRRTKVPRGGTFVPRPGLRVPGTTSPPELALRAVLGQQVSVAGARTITGRLVAAFGEPLPTPVGAVTHAFPTAQRLAQVAPDTLPMPRARATAFVGLAQALADGLDLDDRQALLALKGIGPWTADYVAFRALGDRDAWLPTDLGVKHALQQLGLTNADAEQWRPYRAYAVIHLWTSVLAGSSSAA